MSDRLIKLLDEADLFLRNRANAKSAHLNNYDIEKLEDIAKVCDEAARTLEKAIIPPCKGNDFIYLIIEDVIVDAKVETITCYPNLFSINGIWWDENKKEWNRFVSPSTVWGKEAFATREEALSKLQASYEQVKGGTE